MPQRVVIGGLSRAQLRDQLRASGVGLNAHAETLLDDVPLTAERAETALVAATVAHLGHAEGATLPQIFEAAHELGWSLCPPDTGAYLRLALETQASSTDSVLSAGHAPADALTVASPPVSSDDEYPKGFYLRVVDGRPWLRGYRCDDTYVWSPTDAFVFRIPVALTPTPVSPAE